MRGAFAGVAGSVALGAYGDICSNTIQLETLELRLKNWNADGLKVAFLSDIHVNDTDEMVRAQRACEMLAKTNPDLILFGGDAVNTNATPAMHHIRQSLEPLEHLTCPKLAVLGNHDYWTGSADRIAQMLTESGFQVVKNDVVWIGRYKVACYDDRIGGTIDPSFQPSDLGTIALMHEPDFVEEVSSSVSLQISGHSHGGQICIPFGVPLHTPRGARKYQKGFYPNAKSPLYVSRGVGTVGPKWRMFCPPEVTLLTLRSER